VGASVAAVALGACVIEKHFTLRRADGGVDSAFSLEPAELAALVIETRRAFDAMGGVRYGPTAAEKASIVFRRSLYVVKDVATGEVLTSESVRAIRPGLGLAPRHLESVLGRKARIAIAAGTALHWDLI
jgi:sialic acid synthase SpsE